MKRPMRRPTFGLGEHDMPHGMARLAGNSGWKRASSIGGGNAMFEFRLDLCEVQTGLYPRHTAARVNS
jgi:hypothetical protein